MAREAVILSMKCSPKADSVPLLLWLVPSIAWTELSDTGTDNLGGISQFTSSTVLPCAPSKVMSVSTDGRGRNSLCFRNILRVF
jgi:hypothetical protein